jgi:VanZ family protein
MKAATFVAVFVNKKGNGMKTFFRVFSVICLVGWMGLIFYFSHQTAEQSSAVSGSVITLLAERFYPNFKLLSLLEQQELIASLQSVVRGVAHFCIYGGLGFFDYLTFISYTALKYKARIFWMLETCLLYAICDEFHQTFIDGRSMQLIDLAVDFAGALMAVIICGLFVLIVRPLRRRVAYKYKKQVEIPVIYDVDFQENEFSLEIQAENDQKEPIVMSDSLTDIVENKIENKPKKSEPILSEEFEYASALIGRTVVESTRLCNELSLKSNENKVDLVNLVLGRTEVLKAEILKILNSENSFQDKKDLMQKEQNATYDYFDSIKAQL